MKVMLSFFVIPIVVPIIIGILCYPRKSRKTAALYYPAYVVVLPTILLVFWGVLYVWTVIFQSDLFSLELLPVMIVSLAVYGAAIYLLLKGINWKLEILDDRIRYRNLFRVTKEFSFADIQYIVIYGATKEQRHGKIKCQHDKYKIYIKGKKIVVEYLVYNFSDFLPNIKRKMKKYHCDLIIIPA